MSLFIAGPLKVPSYSNNSMITKFSLKEKAKHYSSTHLAFSVCSIWNLVGYWGDETQHCSDLIKTALELFSKSKYLTLSHGISHTSSEFRNTPAQTYPLTHRANKFYTALQSLSEKTKTYMGTSVSCSRTHIKKPWTNDEHHHRLLKQLPGWMSSWIRHFSSDVK